MFCTQRQSCPTGLYVSVGKKAKKCVMATFKCYRIFLFFFLLFCTYLAVILQHTVGKATVAFCTDLHFVGSQKNQGLLQISCGLVHVGNAVFAVISEVLGCLIRQKPQEGQLDTGSRAILSIAELWSHTATEMSVSTLQPCVHRHDLQLCFYALTWNPPFIVSPNQTRFCSLLLLVHQFFFGTFAILG